MKNVTLLIMFLVGCSDNPGKVWGVDGNAGDPDGNAGAQGDDNDDDDTAQGDDNDDDDNDTAGDTDTDTDTDSDTDSDTDEDAGPDTDTEDGGPSAIDMTWRLHDELESIIYVSWNQLKKSAGYVEYRFADEDWSQTPPKVYQKGGGKPFFSASRIFYRCLRNHRYFHIFQRVAH